MTLQKYFLFDDLFSKQFTVYFKKGDSIIAKRHFKNSTHAYNSILNMFGEPLTAHYNALRLLLMNSKIIELKENYIIAEMPEKVFAVCDCNNGVLLRSALELETAREQQDIEELSGDAYIIKLQFDTLNLKSNILTVNYREVL